MSRGHYADAHRAGYGVVVRRTGDEVEERLEHRLRLCLIEVTKHQAQTERIVRPERHTLTPVGIEQVCRIELGEGSDQTAECGVRLCLNCAEYAAAELRQLRVSAR